MPDRSDRTPLPVGERKFWSGQPAWIGYVSPLFALVAVPTALLWSLPGKGGIVGVVGTNGLLLQLRHGTTI